MESFQEGSRKEKTWNISQRVILRLNFKAHRYFIEPLSRTKHIKFSLYKRLIRFVQKIESSKKGALRTLLYAVKQDCRSTTGENLRKMLMINTHNVDEIQVHHLDQMRYKTFLDEDLWRIGIVKELLDVKSGVTVIPDFAHEEITSMIDWICTS